eukprot:2149423-Pyramimonas_sp.AAC.1
MGAGGGNARHLRKWGPEQQARVPVQRWAREVMIWSVANSNLNEFRHVACVSSRVSGMARKYAGERPPAILIQGGHINGNPEPPVTFLMRSLAERWGWLGVEERARA